MPKKKVAKNQEPINVLGEDEELFQRKAILKAHQAEHKEMRDRMTEKMNAIAKAVAAVAERQQELASRDESVVVSD